MKDIQRFKVLQDVIDKRLTGIQAAEILGLTDVHVSRLKTKLKAGGFEALLRKPPVTPPNKKLTDEHINKIVKLRTDIYFDFNINHFTEKLNEKHGVPYCYATVRNILINAGIHTSRKKRIVHRLRRRMPKAGMLVQMDSSQHLWLPHIKDKWWLIAMIDDATSEVTYACFFQKDTLFNNMSVIRHFIEKKGLFLSLYTDKASHFITTRRGGLHYTVNPEQDDTQIERALNELNITLIPANSPQAKGRVERLFRTFQDRLINEMRLANIKNYSQANKFLLKFFLPDHNNRFALKNIESDFRALPDDINLDTVFCAKFERTVNSDNTIQIQGHTFQIPPSKYHLSFAKRKVDVCILDDNRVIILYRNKVIAKAKLSENFKSIKKQRKIENIINLREYFSTKRRHYIPPKNHPWRKYGSNQSLTFQKIKTLTY